MTISAKRTDVRAAMTAPRTAQMVSPDADAGVGTQGAFLRKILILAKVSGDEVLRISACSLHICFINGARVGHDILTPGWTSYDKRLSFQTCPVAGL